MPVIRTCTHCQQKNRVSAKHLSDTGRCGACKAISGDFVNCTRPDLLVPTEGMSLQLASSCTGRTASPSFHSILCSESRMKLFRYRIQSL